MSGLIWRSKSVAMTRASVDDAGTEITPLGNAFSAISGTLSSSMHALHAPKRPGILECGRKS